jgi:hypothetical protein
MTNQNQGGFFGDGQNFFFVSPEGSTHIITRAYIIANGIRDLCITKGAKPGEVCCRKIVRAKKDEILLLPLGDILWINIDPPYRGNMCSLVLDVGDTEQDVKSLVRALLEYGIFSVKGNQYDMYGGDDYS